MDWGTITLRAFIGTHTGDLLAIGCAKGCGYIAVSQAGDRLIKELEGFDRIHEQRTAAKIERLTILAEQEEEREQAAQHEAHANRVAEMTARQSFESDPTLQRYRASVEKMARLAAIFPEDIAAAKEKLLRREGKLRRRIQIFSEQAGKAERARADARRKKERFYNSLEDAKKRRESYKPLLERLVLDTYRTRINPAQLSVLIEGEDTGRFWDMEEYNRWREGGWAHGGHRP